MPAARAARACVAPAERRSTSSRAGIQCANVFVLPNGDTRDECRDEDVVARVGANRCVNWRYVTRDKKWVMVRDTHRTLNHAGWVFMKIESFPSDRTDWHAYDDRIDEDGDGETDDDRLPNERGTCNQED